VLVDLRCHLSSSPSSPLLIFSNAKRVGQHVGPR
jgi:hypothetical protein